MPRYATPAIGRPRPTWINKLFVICGEAKEKMPDKKIQFFTFDQTVEAVQSEPGAEFVGFKFDEPFTRLGVYIINTYPDEPGNVNVFYEVGTLFDPMGEEDFYDVEEVPAEARQLLYARRTDLGNGDVQVMNTASEFVLQAILPGLHDDAKYRDHAHFMQVAGAEFRGYWGRQ